MMASILAARGASALTDKQLHDLTAAMRAASTLSALGVITIISAFCSSRHFRNPMHRLIFINAFFNAFDVTLTMISTSGPAAGDESALCQFQGFLNQMFPVADVLWTLAMAINVYLIVFHRYDTDSLKRLEWKYMLGITLYTFVPAVVFLFIRTEEKGPMYGSVTLWCAIAPKWMIFRLACYYATIWSAMLAIILLYTVVGIEIAKRKFTLSTTTSDSIPLNSAASLAKTNFPYDDSSIGVAVTVDVAVHSAPRTPQLDALHPTTLCSVSTNRPLTNTHRATRQAQALSFRHYVLMPLFFFLALLSVWVAPSTNRVASFADPTFSSYPLLVAVGVSGSLRGFWNGLVFVTIGMKTWRRGRRGNNRGGF